MPDKKLTDNEIMEALKHCANGEHCRFCRFRGITGTVSDCSKNFLDLINRLQAENKRLDKEVDRLSQVVLYNDGVTEMKVEKAKAEAYKEFAERLKEKIIAEYNEYDEQEYPRARIEDIDNLLKELVGDSQ